MKNGNPRPMPVIVGASRSGTTLLRLMLDAHPDLAIPPETHFLGQASALARQSAPSRDAFAALVESAAWERGWEQHVNGLREELAALDDFDVAAGLRAFYRLYARRRGKSRWGEKTPDYSGIMPQIEGLLPEAHFVHLLRDGRDVAVSNRRAWFGHRHIEVAALEWGRRVRVARTAAPSLHRYMEVRFEDLVRNPRTELERVCRFIDLPFDEAMLRHEAGARERLAEVGPVRTTDGTVAVTPEVRLAAHASAARPADPSLIGSWRTELTAMEVRRFERVAGRDLKRLGYPLATSRAARLAAAPYALHPRLVRHRVSFARRRLWQARRALTRRLSAS